MSMRYIPFFAMNAAAGGGGRVIYEAENQTPTPANTVVGTPVTKKAEFMARLTVTGAEDWEAKTVDALIHGQTSTINGVGVAWSVIDPREGDLNAVRGANSSGRFNTTASGAKYISAFTGLPSDPRTILRLVFDTPVAAFGTYLTDVGDFAGGQMTVTIKKSVASGGGTTAINITHTVGGANGALVFWGFVDNVDTYDSVDITGIGTANSDGYGVDDIVVATAAQLA